MRSISGFSLRSALIEAIRFVPSAIGAAWAPLLLFWLFATLAGQSGGLFAEIEALKLGSFVLLAVTGLIAEGALYRTALFGAYAKAEGLGWGGLQFGKPELRLIGAGFWVLVFFAFIAAFLSLVLALGLNMAGLVTPDMTLPRDLLRYHGKATIAVIAATGFVAIFMIYLGFRLSLYKAATIATHQVVSLNALSLSEGKAFKLFLGAFLLSLPLTVAVGALPLMDVSAAFRIGPEQMDVLGGSLRLSLINQAILKALAIFLVMPALIGFLSSAYRQTVELRAKH